MPEDNFKTDGLKKHVLLFKKITFTAHGMDHFILKTAVNFIAQVIDIDINDIGEGVKINVPYMLGYHGAGDDIAGIAHQIFQQRVFLDGQARSHGPPG